MYFYTLWNTSAPQDKCRKELYASTAFRRYSMQCMDALLPSTVFSLERFHGTWKSSLVVVVGSDGGGGSATTLPL